MRFREGGKSGVHSKWKEGLGGGGVWYAILVFGWLWMWLRCQGIAFLLVFATSLLVMFPVLQDLALSYHCRVGDRVDTAYLLLHMDQKTGAFELKWKVLKF